MTDRSTPPAMSSLVNTERYFLGETTGLPGNSVSGAAQQQAGASPVTAVAIGSGSAALVAAERMYGFAIEIQGARPCFVC